MYSQNITASICKGLGCTVLGCKSEVVFHHRASYLQRSEEWLCHQVYPHGKIQCVSWTNLIGECKWTASPYRPKSLAFADGYKLLTTQNNRAIFSFNVPSCQDVVVHLQFYSNTMSYYDNYALQYTKSEYWQTMGGDEVAIVLWPEDCLHTLLNKAALIQMIPWVEREKVHTHTLKYTHGNHIKCYPY